MNGVEAARTTFHKFGKYLDVLIEKVLIEKVLIV